MLLLIWMLFPQLELLPATTPGSVTAPPIQGRPDQVGYLPGC